MPYSNAQKLQSLGVPTPLAVELQRQIIANVGNSRRLKELGLGGMKLCDYVADAITNGPMSAVQATRLGMNTVLADRLASMVNEPFAALVGFPALQSKRASGSRATMLVLGDSLSAGWGAGGTGGGTGLGSQAGLPPQFLRSKSWPTQLAQLWTSAGIAARADAWVGDGGVGSGTFSDSLLVESPRWDGGGGTSNWVLSGQAIVGGSPYQANASSVGQRFSPQLAANRFDIYYIGTAVSGTWNVSDSSGLLGTFTSTANPLQKVTISRSSPSTLPITIAPASGTGNVFLCAVVPYDTTNPMVEILNGSKGGATAATFLVATNGWSPFNGIPVFAADQILIAVGPNEAFAGVSASTYQSNLQSLAARGKETSAVRLVKQYGSVAHDGLGYDPPASYRSAIDAVTSSLSLLPAINLYDNITITAADTWDMLHRVESGYQKEALYYRTQAATNV